MKRLFFTLSMSLFVLVGLQAQQMCQAYFEAEALGQSNGVIFTNTSEIYGGGNDSIVSYAWDFGDGGTSSEENPTWFYTDSGVYSPCLTITTTFGCTSTFCDSVSTDLSECYAYFTVSLSGATATFNNYSGTPNEYETLWDFGDGNTANTFNPTHTYADDGIYNACLTVIGLVSGCQDTYCLNVNVDTSGGNNDCYSVLAGLHPYAQDDPIFQQVIEQDAFCCNDGWDSLCQGLYDELSDTTITGTPCDDLNAWYTVDGLNVQFSFASNNPVNGASFWWDFGDNNSAQVANPQHTYASAGQYQVILNIVLADGYQCTIFLDVYVDGGSQGECESTINGSNPYAEDDPVFQQVVAIDGFCCDVYWDGLCQQEYEDFGGISDSTECATIINGASPYPASDPLFQQVIAADQFCCDYGWDIICQNAYDVLNGDFWPPNPQDDNICGYVFLGTQDSSFQNIDATVYLIGYDADAGTLTELDSYVISDGDFDYCFDDVGSQYGQQTQLYIKAALNEGSQDYDSFLPSYYDGAITWAEATPVTAGEFINVLLQPGVNPGGAGFIGGLISEGAGKTEGGPLANAQITLMNTDRDPVAYQISDAEGNYAFDNLAYGTYLLKAELLNQRTFHTIISISEQAPSATGIEIIVDGEETVGLGDIIEEEIEWSISPNPVANQFTLSLFSEEAFDGKVEVYNVLGQQVIEKPVAFRSGDNVIPFDASELTGGIYVISVNAGANTITSQKILKQ